jgi:hypothetical protein
VPSEQTVVLDPEKRAAFLKSLVGPA